MNVDRLIKIRLYNKYRYLHYLKLKQQSTSNNVSNNSSNIVKIENNINDEDIIKIIENTITTIISLSIRKRISIFKSCNIIKYFSQNTQSEMVYLLDNYIVCKVFKANQKGFVLWKNELNTLQKIITLQCVPKLIAYNRLVIYMTYCGTLINKSNLPTDWHDQINDIFKEFRKKRVNPNDTLDRNICVLNGKINFIDFGLANNNMTDLRKCHIQVIHSLRRLK
jgi:hypothetical protein